MHYLKVKKYASPENNFDSTVHSEIPQKQRLHLMISSEVCLFSLSITPDQKEKWQLFKDYFPFVSLKHILQTQVILAIVFLCESILYLSVSDQALHSQDTGVKVKDWSQSETGQSFLPNFLLVYRENSIQAGSSEFLITAQILCKV